MAERAMYVSTYADPNGTGARLWSAHLPDGTQLCPAKGEAEARSAYAAARALRTRWDNGRVLYADPETPRVYEGDTGEWRDA